MAKKMTRKEKYEADRIKEMEDAWQRGEEKAEKVIGRLPTEPRSRLKALTRVRITASVINTYATFAELIVEKGTGRTAKEIKDAQQGISPRILAQSKLVERERRKAELGAQDAGKSRAEVQAAGSAAAENARNILMREESGTGKGKKGKGPSPSQLKALGGLKGTGMAGTRMKTIKLKAGADDFTDIADPPKIKG